MINIEALNLEVPGFSLRDISLNIGDRDFFAVIGPTGAGKSLLLEAIAGLAPVKSGRITVKDQEITAYPPECRNVGLVYQDCSLFPHLTVKANILYGIRYHRMDSEVANARLDGLVNRLDLSRLLRRYPARLSGGEKQRVALARVLMLNPAVILLDEPLSSLDPVFQDDIKQLLRDIHQEWRIPFIIVSHDFADVLYLADRGAVIDNGRVVQQGGIQDIFDRPASSFVARFVGMSNVFPCQVKGSVVKVGTLDFSPDQDRPVMHRYLGIRPEAIRLVTESGDSGPNVIKGEIAQISSQGFFAAVKVRCGEITINAVWPRETVAASQLRPGSAVKLGISPERLHTF